MKTPKLLGLVLAMALCVPPIAYATPGGHGPSPQEQCAKANLKTLRKMVKCSGKLAAIQIIGSGNACAPLAFIIGSCIQEAAADLGAERTKYTPSCGIDEFTELEIEAVAGTLAIAAARKARTLMTGVTSCPGE